MCRVPTNFITPSSKFWKAGTREKDNVVKAYKESMSRVPCRCVCSISVSYALLIQVSLVPFKSRYRRIRTSLLVLLEKIVSINM